MSTDAALPHACAPEGGPLPAGSALTRDASSSPPLPLSVLDLAPVRAGESVADTFRASVALARSAERLGYHRVWYAEHHNLPAIASSATSVLIAHIAAHTSTIRLGAGGVMLPNHTPLTIAEHYGTLEILHPGRIDLGLGRAPGTDGTTAMALRSGPAAAARFPEDVLELQGYLSDHSRVPGVEASPGKGTRVPLYILGSSLYGAGLAAALGLPYAFASHFAPQALESAVATYRREFRPSAQLSAPYVIAGVNVIAASSQEEADAELLATRRSRVSWMFGRGRTFSDAEADAILASPAGQQMADMLRYAAVGTPTTVRRYLEDFAVQAGADELMIVHQSSTTSGRMQSLELVAGVMGPKAAR